MTRLAIVCSHPIQYYAPWFRYLAANTDIDLRVFYLWDFGVSRQRDPGFGQSLVWDVDLLSGYAHEFVRNVSWRPGTQHFLGLINPGLGAALRRFRADAVLLIGYAQASPLWLGLSTRLPLLHRGDSHVLAGPAGRTGIRSWLRRRLLRRCSAHLAVGHANAEWLKAHGVTADKIHFCPHAIEQSRFRLPEQEALSIRRSRRAALGIDDKALCFGFIGKLETKKRPLDLLQAFQREADPENHLLFVGSGELNEPVQAAASAANNVHHLPFVNQSDMPGVYAAIDVLVLPSQGAYETWGLVVNEAQCQGIPAIVSDHVGCHPDLVRPGQTGWVFPAGEIEALRVCLREAASDRERLSRFGEHARQLADHYSYPAATAGLMSALKAIGVAS